jgi:GDPmannose 4,6-dehydratase
MKALIFGSNGQDGYYLSRLLKGQNIEVIGISRSKADVIGSVSDYQLVKNLVERSKPQYIFHLAANSTTRHDALFENHDTISSGTLNILESVRLSGQKTKVFLSGSGLQFLNIGEPISEETPFDATNAYAVSRIQSVYAARYFRTLGLQVYVGYFFNHESPLRSERHVSKMIAEAVKRISDGSNEKISIGNLSTKKEWTFAGDIVNGIWKFVQQDKFYEAVIGSGRAYSIQDWLTSCFQLINKDWGTYVQEKKDFKAEYEILVSDPALIKSTGWEPEKDLTSLSKLMVFGNSD